MKHTIKDPEIFRKNIKNKLLEKVKTEKNAVNLEKGIFNWTIKECTNRKVVKKWENQYFIQIYLDKLKSVYFNLNEQILTKLFNNEITSQDIAFMTHQELDYERWEKLIKAKNKRTEKKSAGSSRTADLS